MFFFLPCTLLMIILQEADSSQYVRNQQYTQIEGKQMSGEVIYSGKVNVSLECGAACLQLSCDTYNIITRADNDIFCEIIGNQTQQDVTDNPLADYYCK